MISIELLIFTNIQCTTGHSHSNVEFNYECIVMEGLQWTHVVLAEDHGWSHRWFRFLVNHYLVELPDLSFPILSTQFFSMNAPYDCCYDFCIPIWIIILLRLCLTPISVSSLSWLQEAIMLPPISYLIEGPFQLPTFRSCVPEVLVIFTILVLISKIGWSFDGLWWPQQWVAFYFHQDVLRASVKTLSPFLHSSLDDYRAGCLYLLLTSSESLGRRTHL